MFVPTLWAGDACKVSYCEGTQWEVLAGLPGLSEEQHNDNGIINTSPGLTLLPARLPCRPLTSCSSPAAQQPSRTGAANANPVALLR